MSVTDNINVARRFGVLAEYYDLLNYGVKYKKIADYVEGIFRLYNVKPEIVLDLACGTGNLTIELDKRGYDMIGLDLSDEMLSAAIRKKRRGKPKSNILWINQDMTDFELYGTVDAVVCVFDSLNYILNEDDFRKCFKLVCNYLNEGGVFIFDVNSKYKFENVYGKNDFILENSSKDKNVFCAWRNYYDKKTQICDFAITLFVKDNDTNTDENPNGDYQRYDELQREKYYSEKFLTELLETLNFTDINIFYDFDINSRKYYKDNNKNNDKNRDEKRERICFSCIKKSTESRGSAPNPV